MTIYLFYNLIINYVTAGQCILHKKRKIKIYIYMYAVAIKNKTFLKPYFIYCMKLGRKKGLLLKIKVALYTLKEREREDGHTQSDILYDHFVLKLIL